MSNSPKQRSLREYLPKKAGKLKFIQGRIPEPLFDELKPAIENLGISWNEYFESVSRRFLDEVRDWNSDSKLPAAKQPAGPSAMRDKTRSR